MGKLWINNEIVDRLAMLQRAEAENPGVNQVAIEKGLVGNDYAQGVVPNRLP